MPELPEVSTTVAGLKKVLPGLTITHAWTDLSQKNPIKQFKNTLKDEAFLKKFKKYTVGAKVLTVERRAKNILIHLSNKHTLLIHLKMTGHIIYGRYIFNKKTNTWSPAIDERVALHDPFNRFIHVVFSLSNGKQFVLCDARKFGKVTLISPDEHDTSIHLRGLGPEPLDADFSYKKFSEALIKKPLGNIKTVLMNQMIIAGIGNIYSDEMLWLADIHPESKPTHIPALLLKNLFTSMKKVLTKGIDFGGDSMSDYRDIDGNKGSFQNHHNVYRKTGATCSKRQCRGVILRKVINGRSAHYCNIHQKLF